MLAKINSIRGVIFIFSLALLLSGCTPAGPRALLKGKKYLDRGDVADAVTQFRRATTLLATNATAWNYLGVALQQAGQLDEAANAYRNALRFDHDLLEAHFNLGVLSLDQSKFDIAKSELTTYTLRRQNDATGWLKLGFAQLRGGGDTLPAERSFSTVLSLRPNDVEAYNGLGLCSLQAGKSRDAERFFAAAVQARPDFGPALLNLATVNLQYLHDKKAAIANYNSYLVLTPRPANYNEVRDMVAGLEQGEAPPAPAPTPAPSPVVARTTAPVPAQPEPKPKNNTVASTRSTPASRVETNETRTTRVAQRPTTQTTPAPVIETTVVPTQTVQVQPEPQIVTTPRPYRPATTPQASTTNVVVAQEPLEAPMPEDQNRSGFWHRWFGSSVKPSNSKPANPDDNVTPPPGTTTEVTGTKIEEKTPSQPTQPQPQVQPTPQPIVSFSRYPYRSPSKPVAGDHQAAAGAYTKAQIAEQDENLVDAHRWYQTAADFDPSWFQAQYNTGVTAQQLGNYSVALPRYEMALAIQPDSVDTRYNFALALKAAGYALDSAAELKKILAINPDEVRAHLALANLYAQTIHDIPQARQHYLRVLALDPNNAHAADIRFWLSANGK